MDIIDRIKYDGTTNDYQWLVYKYPSEQFVLGSQLIVNQGQEALLFKGGKALDLFGEGTHTLSTENLPILNKFVNLLFGGKTPFTAEVYYINKTASLDLKWGTSLPILLEDPKYGLILNVGARGQYGICINDTRLFVSRIVGAVPGGTRVNQMAILKYFNGLINAKIKTVTAEYMIKKKISFLEISQYLSELSDAFKENLNDEFERFGIEIINFYCESIAPRPEEYEKLRGYKEELALGEEFYQRRRSLDIIEKLAVNSSVDGVVTADIDLRVVGQVGNTSTDVDQNLNINKTDQEIICPKCGEKNNLSMKFCGECGNELVLDAICSRCGACMPIGIKFCGNCGQKL